MKFVAVSSSGARSPVSESRQEIDDWASEEIHKAEQVLVYAQNKLRSKYRGELVGIWQGPVKHLRK